MFSDRFEVEDGIEEEGGQDDRNPCHQQDLHDHLVGGVVHRVENEMGHVGEIQAEIDGPLQTTDAKPRERAETRSPESLDLYTYPRGLSRTTFAKAGKTCARSIARPGKSPTSTVSESPCMSGRPNVPFAPRR